MKKQIFYLIFGTAIFMADQAFCMDDSQEELGRGNLCVLAPEMEIMVIENLDNVSTRAMACTSSYFHGLAWGNVLNELDLYISYNFEELQDGRPQINYENVSFSLCDLKAGFLKNISFCTNKFLTNNFSIHNTKEQNSRGLIKQKVILHKYGPPEFMMGGASENLKEFHQKRVDMILWPQNIVFNSKKQAHEIGFVRNSKTCILPPMNLYINSSFQPNITIRYTMGDHVKGEKMRRQANIRELKELRNQLIQQTENSPSALENLEYVEEQLKELEEDTERKL